MAKTIFITGGGSGIGRAVAQRFAQEGWFIGLADIDEAGLAGTAALLPDGMSSTHRLDVTDREAWGPVLADFAAKGGERLDVLFNNAGLGIGGPIDVPSDADHDRLIAVNFVAVITGIRAALPMLRATPGSAILNTGSAAGIYGTAGLSVYSATKFAVRGLTEALDTELGAQGIKVRSLMPGFIDTPLLTQVVPGTNHTSRDRVVAAGLEFTPVETVADAAWAAVHGDRVHSPIGKTAKSLTFAARWMPGKLRRRMLMAGKASLG